MRLRPFPLFATLALIVTLLAIAACFAFPLSPPLARYLVTSPFGYRMNPLPRGAGGDGGESLHDGEDQKGPDGSAIHAASDGVIVEHWPAPGAPVPGKPGKTFSGHRDYGGYIVIDHGNGVYTKYAHMRTTFVRTGQYVRTGQIIGQQGATGKVTGDHLHFSVSVDPHLLLLGQTRLIMSLAEYRSLLR